MRHHPTSSPFAVVAAVLTSAVLLGGCGDDGTVGSDSSTTSTTPVTSTSTTSPASTTSGAGSEVGDVTLTVTGGVAGIDEEVVVRGDGTVLRSTARGTDPQPTGDTMSAADLATLHDRVGSGEFAALEDTYIPDGLCCDQFHYEVTAQVGDTTITSATADGVEAPAVLGDVVAQLRGALDDG